MIKLEVSNLEMNFDGMCVLDNINFQVYNGEFLSILGSSGCGKSTLLRLLIGLQSPSSGNIYKDGVDITDVSPSGRGMGIVFQNYALFENMTVFQNVEYALKIRRENQTQKAKEMIRVQVMDMIRRVGLEEHIDKYPRELSGGQQQRVAIARTLVMQPDIILFDEPMSALDAATRMSLRRELQALHNELGFTVIYVTHDQEEAFSMSDRIMVMKDAQIVQIGTIEEIVHQPASEYVREFVVENLQMKIDSMQRFLDARRVVAKE